MSTGKPPQAAAQEKDPAPQAPRPAADLAASWRIRAAKLRRRANQLGDCRRGLEAFTEACVLNECAAELDGLSGGRKGS